MFFDIFVFSADSFGIFQPPTPLAFGLYRRGKACFRNP